MYIPDVIVGVAGTLLVEFAMMTIMFFVATRGMNDESDEHKSDK